VEPCIEVPVSSPGGSDFVTGTLTGFASISHSQLRDGLNTSAATHAGFRIGIVDEVVPAMNGSYRDFFSLEFGPGYFALGNPTPVAPATWGGIKGRSLH
jgi:hypothetical protein